jgi:hypothetical protein
MQSLSKTSKDYLLSMIKAKENINYIIAFCQGLGLNTKSHSSPVFISEQNVISIRYRREMSYYYL